MQAAIGKTNSTIKIDLACDDILVSTPGLTRNGFISGSPLGFEGLGLGSPELGQLLFMEAGAMNGILLNSLTVNNFAKDITKC